MKLLVLFENISKQLDKVVKYVVFLLITGMIFSITAQIIFRVFFDSLTWTEEISRYLLVWSTFLGATMAYYRGMHINVTFVVDALSPKLKKVIQVLAILLTAGFFSVAIFYGIQYMSLQIYQVSAALRLPMKWVYIVMPVSFAIMTVHAVTAILEVIYKGKAGVIR